MTRRRETVRVAAVRDLVNGMLAADGCDEAGAVALCVMVERVLMDAGQYRGFRDPDPSRPLPIPCRGRCYY